MAMNEQELAAWNTLFGNRGSVSPGTASTQFPQIMQTQTSGEQGGIDWDQLLGAGIGALGTFFGNNAATSGYEDALAQYGNSPVLGELRGLRGLLGTTVQNQYPGVLGYDREARTRDITQDLFNVARPGLEQQAGQTVGQDYLQGTLGLDIGGRGSPLQQAFSKNLGSEISRANVMGSQQAIQEESAMRNMFLNDIQGIRQLAGEDIDLQQALLSLGKTEATNTGDTISGIGDILSGLFGGGGAGSGAASGLVSQISDWLTGGGGGEFSFAMTPEIMQGIEPFADIFGDSALELVQGLGGNAGELISSFGPFAGGAFNAGPSAFTPEMASSLSNVFGSGLGPGGTFSTGTGAAGGEGGGLLSNLFGGGGEGFSNPFSGLSELFGGGGAAANAGALGSVFGTGVGSTAGMGVGSAAYGSLGAGLAAAGPAMAGVAAYMAAVNALTSPGGDMNPVTGKAAMPGDPIPTPDQGSGSLTSTPLESISGFLSPSGRFSTTPFWEEGEAQGYGRPVTIQRPKLGPNTINTGSGDRQVWIPPAVLAGGPNSELARGLSPFGQKTQQGWDQIMAAAAGGA